MGMEGLVEEFESAGYQVVDSKQHDGISLRSAIPYGTMPIDKEVQAVVMIIKFIRNFRNFFRFQEWIMPLIIISFGMQHLAYMSTMLFISLPMKIPI